MNDYPCYIAGQAVNREDKLSVYNPYNGEVAGTVANLGKAETIEAIETALQGGETLSRYQRYEILDKARRMLLERAEEFSSLITAESGLCLKETTYEVGRGHDVLQFSAMEALKDDGEIFSCDVSPHGKSRKIFTLREPHKLVAAITPFNHPLNQVLHKIAPAIACGAATILKPSSKTPLVAVKITELLYEAGLPGWMLSVLVGPSSEVADTLVTDPRVEVVSFTGGETVGKMIAERAGYKKLVLELGGNSPLIIMEDADLDLAINLAAEGCFRNSGQRCTAVKRLLVHEAILETFTERFVEEAGNTITATQTIQTPALERLSTRMRRSTSRRSSTMRSPSAPVCSWEGRERAP